VWKVIWDKESVEWDSEDKTTERREGMGDYDNETTVR
jgi:hypothetical protein